MADVIIPVDRALDFLLRAAAADKAAGERVAPDTNEEYIDEGVLDAAYAQGAFDAVNFLCNLAGATDALQVVLRSGEVEGDDYPPLEGAFR